VSLGEELVLSPHSGFDSVPHEINGSRREVEFCSLTVERIMGRIQENGVHLEKQAFEA
jgi:hypothetical protein